jgi:hypothetical protein
VSVKATDSAAVPQASSLSTVFGSMLLRSIDLGVSAKPKSIQPYEASSNLTPARAVLVAQRFLDRWPRQARAGLVRLTASEIAATVQQSGQP